MVPNKACLGKTYPPTVYEIGREKVKEYANAVGDPNPLYSDLEYARKSKYGNIVAPPMFAVVYQRDTVAQVIFDADLCLNLPFLVHGEQDCEFFEAVVSGDEITSVATVKEIYEKQKETGFLDFVVTEIVSSNQHGRPVCKGTMTFVIRRV